MPLAWYSRRGRNVYHVCLECKDWDNTGMEFVSEKDAEDSRHFELCVSNECVSHASRRRYQHRDCQALTSEVF